MPARTPICGAIVLAGGLNTRMQGCNKAFLEVGGRAIVDRLIGTLEGFFKEILLVTREPSLYAGRSIRVVEDIFEARSSLTGIHAGLRYMDADFAFVAPCDTPFVQPALIRTLLSEIGPQVDAIVPMVDRFYEPLCAIYSKRCLAPIEEQLERGDYKITRFFDRIRLKTIPTETVRRADARMLSFFNVNTPEALEASRKLIGPGADSAARKEDPPDD